MKIFVAHTPTEAHLLCGLLKQIHIGCEVRGEALFGLRGELPISDDTAPYIWLYDIRQQEAALRVIEEYLNPLCPVDTTPWRCAHCGEINERQFAVCWHCGHVDSEAPAC